MSLRQVTTTNPRYSSFGPKPPPCATIGPVSLVLQALALDGTDLGELWLDPGELVATYDRGLNPRPNPMPAALMPSSGIARGCIWLVPMEAHARGTTCLREVGGTLVRLGAERRAYRFCLVDVPLPSADRVHGRVALECGQPRAGAPRDAITLERETPAGITDRGAARGADGRTFAPLHLVLATGRASKLWFPPDARGPDVSIGAKVSFPGKLGIREIGGAPPSAPWGRCSL
ncbi:MAG TPA: hypothetical protein VLH79_10010 [Chthonomonadales bacterium]|nr:hypothetical protein [Chthonomonadales bacterium]